MRPCCGLSRLVTGGGHGEDVIHKLAIQDRETTVEEDIHLVQSFSVACIQEGIVRARWSSIPIAV